MEIRILGPFEVETSDGEQVNIAPANAELLALLAAHQPRVVSDDVIIESLWPDQAAEREVRGRLRTRVSKLRAALKKHGDDVVRRAATGYSLDESVSVDARASAELNDEAAGFLDSDPAEARRVLDEALGFWRGDPYADFAYADWTTIERSHLWDLKHRITENRIDADLALGRGPELLHELESAVASEPLDERARARFMLALYRSGKQADALRQYTEVTELLADRGALPGDELRSMNQRIVEHDAALPGPARTEAQSRLPSSPTRFFGRAAELERLEQLVALRPFVTVIGIGGVGKTRLALEAARRLEGRFPGGAVFVDLSTLPPGVRVDSAVAGALGLRQGPDRRSVDAVAELLAVRPSLLVLDNCEHVSDSVQKLASELIARAPESRILATSRQPIDAEGEQRFPVGPLSLGGITGQSTEGDAVELFFDRRALLGEVEERTDQSVENARRICKTLGGFPLAIELAARRFSVGGLAELAAELASGDSLDWEDPQEAAIQWSYNQASDDAKALFRTLGLAIGGQSLLALAEWPERYPLGETSVSSLMQQLNDAGLVSRTNIGGESRFELLEPVRQFALRQLESSGEVELAGAVHAAIHARIARALNAQLLNDPRTAERTKAEMGNFTTAMQRMLEAGRPLVAAKIAVRLDYFWVFSGRAREGAGWVDAIIAAGALESAGTAAAPLDRIDELLNAARLLHARGFLASVDLLHDRSERAFQEAIRRYDEVVAEIDDADTDRDALARRRASAIRDRAWSKFLLARNYTSKQFSRYGLSAGPVEDQATTEADRLYGEARATFEQEGLEMDLAFLDPFLGWNKRLTGAVLSDADADYGLARATRLGLAVPTGIAHCNIALHYLAQGNSPQQALKHAEASVATFEEIGDLYSLQIAQMALATAALQAGDDASLNTSLRAALELVTTLGSKEWEAWPLGLAAALGVPTDPERAGAIMAWLDASHQGWRRLLEATGVPERIAQAGEAAASGAIRTSSEAARLAMATTD